MFITCGGFFPVVAMLVTHLTSSSLVLGLIRISKANNSTILVISWMKRMAAKDAKSACLALRRLKLSN